MPYLRWSGRAQDDVLRLRRFLWRHNPRAAREAVGHGAKLVAERPEIGRLVESARPDVREWPVAFGKSGYLVRYQLRGDTVLIIAVRHFREAGF